MAKEIAPGNSGNSGWFVASVAVLNSFAHFTWSNRKHKLHIFLICLYMPFNVIQIIRLVYVIYENTLGEHVLNSKLTVIHRRKDVGTGLRKYSYDILL